MLDIYFCINLRMNEMDFQFDLGSMHSVIKLIFPKIRLKLFLLSLSFLKKIVLFAEINRISSILLPSPIVAHFLHRNFIHTCSLSLFCARYLFGDYSTATLSLLSPPAQTKVEFWGAKTSKQLNLYLFTQKKRCKNSSGRCTVQNVLF